MPVFFKKARREHYENTIALDGAGIIYPYAANKNWNNVYRAECVLKTEINKEALQKAVNKMQALYPYFFSHLVKVKKEYRFAKTKSRLIIRKDDCGICKPFDINGTSALIRVLYEKNKIALEVFHAITDGHGSLEFFRELLIQYSRNIQAQTSIPVFTPGGSKNQELIRLDDIYKNISKTKVKNINRIMPFALTVGKGKEKTPLNVTHIRLYTDEVLSAAKIKGVTLSMYICSLLILSIIENEKPERRKIRISVPADIRGLFNESTSRNGSLYILVEINPNEITDFDNLLHIVKKQFEEKLTKEKMQSMAYSNVKAANTAIFKMLPIPLKKLALNISYKILGENQISATLTNLGNIKLPNSLYDITDSIYFILGRQKTNAVNLTLSSFNNITEIVISSTVCGDDYVQTLMNLLCAGGICVISKFSKTNRPFDKYGQITKNIKAC